MASRQLSNFVLLPAQLNVGAIRDLWLLENRILQREDLAGEAVFTPIAVSVKSPRIELLILPNMVQFAPRDGPDPERTVSDVVMAFVSSLPTTQFTAAGVNLHYWHDVENIAEISRSLWLCPANPWANEYTATDAQFGFYASRDVLDCRLKADAKPARHLSNGKNGILFAFNFHKDLSPAPTGVDQIRSLVASWNRAGDIAQGLVNAVVERTTVHV
jgi:hypothetical protein